jgi:hypothetical protein
MLISSINLDGASEQLMIEIVSRQPNTSKSFDFILENIRLCCAHPEQMIGDWGGQSIVLYK